jgi:2-polyprenyl-6-methoxyphenol hydroxylase-like FAD-dependent oxidoreductase
VPFEHSFLVYQSEKIHDRVDYLAAFTMNRTTRVNLFTYRSYHDPWTRAFINDPGPGLAQLLPGFGRVMGPYRAVGPAVARPIDLYTSHGHQQDGVVLIGDAFQMSCPATGMGMVFADRRRAALQGLYTGMAGLPWHERGQNHRLLP